MDENKKSDIPMTLEDAYKKLDKMLTKKQKEAVGKATRDELFLMHFGLGLRIRNEWFYPAIDNGLMKHFLDNGVIHQDSASMFVIEGYRRYLSGRPCDIRAVLGYKTIEK
ncbi:MAG: GTP cyclohydrolase [Ruminococcaceae bacterium]|nr:GTP cyclohydrolase [Oscillospiraceae bacterium]